MQHHIGWLGACPVATHLGTEPGRHRGAQPQPAAQLHHALALPRPCCPALGAACVLTTGVLCYDVAKVWAQHERAEQLGAIPHFQARGAGPEEPAAGGRERDRGGHARQLDFDAAQHSTPSTPQEAWVGWAGKAAALCL